MRPESAVSATFSTIRSELARLVARIVRRADIEDIVQETFVRSYQAELRHPIEHPRAFMLKTAKHLALNHLGCGEQRLVDSLEDFPAHTELLAEDNIQDRYESHEQFVIFCQAVRELQPQCRRVFILKKVYDLSQREIADYLKISESTVEKHVAKGILECSRHLDAAGFSLGNTRGKGSPSAQPVTRGRCA